MQGFNLRVSDSEKLPCSSLKYRQFSDKLKRYGVKGAAMPAYIR